MLVDAINHRGATDATETTVLGPFYVEAAPARPLGADISAGLAGEPLLVTGSGSSGEGRALAGATGDVWHSGDDGYYDGPHPEGIGGPALRARLFAREKRRLPFLTV